MVDQHTDEERTYAWFVALRNMFHSAAMSQEPIEYFGTIQDHIVPYNMVEAWLYSIRQDDGLDTIHDILDKLSAYSKGSLDLYGRHPIRYARFMAHFFLAVLEVTKAFGEVSANPQRHPPMEKDEANEYVFEWYNNANQCNRLIRKIEQAKVLVAASRPRFQQVLLTNLPIELLHVVVDCMGINEVRSLRSTCRLMKDICSSHFLQECQITFRSIYHFPEGTEVSKYCKTEFSRLVQRFGTVLACDDLLRKICSLTLGVSGLSNALHDINIPADQIRLLMRTICWQLVPVLRQATKTQELVLNSVVMDKDFTTAVLNLPHLQSLILDDCHIELVPDALSRLPVSNSLLNISILTNARDRSSRDTYEMLSHTFGIRHLVHFGSMNNTGIVPPTLTMALRNPFLALERVLFYDLYHGDIEKLSAWMLQAASLSPNHCLCLTHFNVYQRHGMTQSEILDLLNILRTAPLRFLVLNGIGYARPDIIARISEVCPMFEALSLMYLDSTRQRWTKSVRWPCPVYEYAARLQGFPRLKYFCFNNFVEHRIPSPSIMRMFEDGTARARYDTDETEDWKPMTRLFKIHCPTL